MDDEAKRRLFEAPVRTLRSLKPLVALALPLSNLSAGPITCSMIQALNASCRIPRRLAAQNHSRAALRRNFLTKIPRKCISLSLLTPSLDVTSIQRPKTRLKPALLHHDHALSSALLSSLASSAFHRKDLNPLCAMRPLIHPLSNAPLRLTSTGRIHMAHEAAHMARDLLNRQETTAYRTARTPLAAARHMDTATLPLARRARNLIDPSPSIALLRVETNTLQARRADVAVILFPFRR
jgi:hypothetical protein